MVKVMVLDWEGKETGELTLPDIFSVKPDPAVVHNAVLRANRVYSAPYGHVKTRSEVRGGGAKPWRQKGTGRARAGSSRSPLWIGGGVIFGPNKNRSFTSRLNNKEIKLAVKMLLSEFAKSDHLIVLEEIPKITKTKEFKSSLDKIAKGKILIITEESDKLIAARNIPELSFSSAKNLGVPQLMLADTVILEKKSVDILKDRL